MPTRHLPARRLLAAVFFGLCLCVLSARPSRGQQPQPDSALATPRLLILTPPGGKSGSTVEVGFSGADLDAPEKLLFNHPNIKAEPVQPPAPPAPPAADPKKPPMPMTPPPVTKFKVTIAPDVPPGTYDARLVTKHGVSNPRAFVVGDLNEVMEKEPNNDLPEAQRVEINTTINGNLSNPTDVDYYVFAGKKGQRVVVSCQTSSIDSRMTAALDVYDAKGKLLAFSRNYSHNDALTDLTLPADGDYYVRLYEFTHTQGTAEHFYRLSITTAPWIDAIHPAVIEPGKTVQATIYGRNLPGGQLDPNAVVDGRTLEKLTVSITAPNDPAALHRLAYSGHIAPNASGLNGCFEYLVKNAAGSSNPFLLSLATAPVVVDNEKNHTMETAQPIALPCEIAGRVLKKRERNWYVFSAKKGDIYNIELLSDRLGVAGYMYFVLRNFDTKADLMESQDNNDILNLKFFARSEDPQVYRFTVPADGKYALMVSSRLADALAGPRQQYRVRLTPDQPDFQLVAMPYSNEKPSATTVYPGGQQALTVFAWRRDGFNGEIVLNVEGLPPGVTCPPQTLAHGTRQTTLVLSAAQDAAAWTGDIKINGTATIKGQKVTKEARSGCIVWPVQPQQNIPPISRVERQTFLAVRDKAPWTLTATLDKPSVVQGTNAVVSVKLNRLSPDFKAPLAVQATVGELPQGFTVNNNQPITIAADKTDGTLNVVVPANTPPGTYNIVLRTTAQIPMENAGKKGKQPTNIVLPATPVTLTVLPKAVATVALATPNPTAKIGMTTELIVKVTRLHEFDGEFKVKVVLPPDAKGVTVDEVVIPAGKDEAKLLLKVAEDAMPGNRANLAVVAAAMYNGNVPINQEAKFNVNIVK
jgi:Bacterial pre-peptidase C-terminal domain